MNDIDLAYLAGLIDGEGSIQVCARRKDGSRFRLILCVAMQNQAPLQFLSDTFNFGTKPRRHRTQGAYRIEWQGPKAAVIIEAILPYLKVKQEQARLGLLFQNRVKNRSRKGWSPEERDQNRRISDLMKALNREDSSAYHADRPRSVGYIMAEALRLAVPPTFIGHSERAYPRGADWLARHPDPQNGCLHGPDGRWLRRVP